MRYYTGTGFYLLIVILILENTLSSNSEYLPTLRLAHVIYRHGARAPDGTYPTDPNQEEAWPGGWGSLTQLGINQQYQLGQYFRRYFTGFINASYDSKEIFVRSTDIDRTLISAYSNLAGLYGQDGTGPVRNPLVPVHAPVPYSLDALLNMNVNCDTYYTMVNEVSGAEAQQYLRENQEFVTMVQNKSGMGPNASLWDISFLIPDAVKFERVHNMPQPDWLTEEVFDKLWELRELQFCLWVYTPQMTAMKSGLFYRQLTKHLEDYISGKTDADMKIYFYSAHDSGILVYLESLSLWDGKIPEFASTLMYELHEREPGEFYIRILYRNDTQPESEVRVLQIPGCDSFCPVDKFNKITAPYTWQSTWQDWYRMCDGHQNSAPVSASSSSSNIVLGIVIVAALALCFVLVGLGVYLTGYCRTKKYKSYTAL